jgi:hypothetical protein
MTANTLVIDLFTGKDGDAWRMYPTTLRTRAAGRATAGEEKQAPNADPT